MSEVIQRNAEEVEAIAASLGLVCFIADDRELQLDLDNNKIPVHLARVTEVLEQNGWSVVDTLRTTSKGGGAHLYIKMGVAIGPLQRIALQAMLGSDPVREVLSMLRLSAGATASTALFETPDMALRVVKWRKKHCFRVYTSPVIDSGIFTNF